MVVHLRCLWCPTCAHVCACTYLCWLLPACLLPACNWGKHAQSDTHTHTNTLHIAYPHQSSPTQCCWPAVCPVQTDCWVQERCMVVWPWPDKAAPPSPFSICLSLTHLQPYDNPSTRLTPQAALHKHLVPLPLFMPRVPSSGWCMHTRVCPLSLPTSPPSLS